MRPRTLRQAGLTLLEVLLASAIFALASGVAVEISQNAVENTNSANNQRILRMLAAHKLGEVLTFEQHALDEYFEGDFADDYSEYEGLYDGWEWKLDVIDRELFPPAAEDHGEPLLPDPDTTTDEDDEEIRPETETQKPRENNQTLTEIRLIVNAPGEEGARDFIEVVMLLAPGDAAPPGPAAPGPGGR